MSKNTTGTAEEKAIHKEATRLRKMTDVQLVTAFKEAKEGNKKTEDNPVKTLIDGLPRYQRWQRDKDNQLRDV